MRDGEVDAVKLLEGEWLQATSKVANGCGCRTSTFDILTKLVGAGVPTHSGADISVRTQTGCLRRPLRPIRATTKELNLVGGVETN